MNASSVAHVFIDTNTALHFKRPNEIDWQSLTGANEIFLVAAPILMRELENQKIHNASKKLRERADAYIKWLLLFVRDPSKEVRPGLRWRFIPNEPQIDFETNNLSLNNADDQLIGSVLCYTVEHTGPIYVATADIGLEVKLLGRQLTPLTLPEDAKLPVEMDLQDKEIRDLRNQLAKHESRIPRLSLVSHEGKGLLKVKIRPPAATPAAPSLSEVRTKYSSMAGPVVQIQNIGISPAQIASYNKERDQFFAEYSRYLDELATWEEVMRLIVEVRFSVANGGTAPASDVDVVLSFPKDIELLEHEDLLNRPEEPKPPRRPVPGLLGSIPGLLNKEIPSLNLHNFHIPSDNDGKPYIVSEKQQVEFNVSNLKHGFERQLKPFLFGFPDKTAVRSFSIDFHLSAAEIPEAVTGDFYFVVSQMKETTAQEARARGE